jgi:hypothetical protein
MMRNFIWFFYYQGEVVLQNYVTSHMWLNISSANSFSDAGKLRDLIAKEMTSDLLVEALRRTSVCMAFNYQDYD